MRVTDIIDKQKLAANVIVKRRQLGLTQKDIAEKLNLPPWFISYLEVARVGFTKSEHYDHLKKLTGLLKIEIPYLDDSPNIRVKSFEELSDILNQKQEVPEKQPEPKKKIDPELLAMMRCENELIKIDDIRGRSRVINYLEDKLVLSHLSEKPEEE